MKFLIVFVALNMWMGMGTKAQAVDAKVGRPILGQPVPDRAGGGGNIIKPLPLTANNIPLIVLDSSDSLNYKLALRDIFRALEYDFKGSLPGSSDYSAEKKLFSKNKNGQTIYQVLDLVNFTFSSVGCEDLDGIIKDGSAFNNGPFTVCLWPENIVTETNGDDFYRDLTALVIHEISHYMDTSEEEALALQKSLKYLLVAGSVGSRSFHAGDVRNYLKEISEGTEKIKLKIADPKVEDTDICSRLGFLSYQASAATTQFFGFLSKDVSSPLPLKEAYIYTHVLMLRAFFNQATFCISQDDPEKIEVQAKTDENGYVAVKQMVHGDRGFAKEGDNFKLKILNKGDRDGLLKQLDVFLSEVEIVKKGLSK